MNAVPLLAPILLCCLGLGTLAAQDAPAGTSSAVGDQVPLLVSWAGITAISPASGAARIEDQHAWEKTWSDQGLPAEACPHVDFTTLEVIVITRGRDLAGVFAESLSRTTDGWELHYAAGVGQIADLGVGPHVERVRGNGYGLFLIPRLHGHIFLAHDTRDLISSPPCWVRDGTL